MNFIHIDTSSIFPKSKPDVDWPPDIKERMQAGANLDEAAQRKLIRELALEVFARSLPAISLSASYAGGERLSLAREADLRWRR